MATQTLVANTNLSALTIGAGDVIQLAGFNLNFDASPANPFTVASNNAASRMTVAAGSWTVSCSFNFTVASSAACGTVAAGQSLTINNSSIAGWVSSNSALWTNTGGTLLISAGSTSNFFYNSPTSVGFVPITSSGGTSTLTGQISGNFNSGTLFSCSGGSITVNGNITQIGASQVIPLTGSGVFTHNGNLVVSGTIGATGYASSAGSTSVLNINGNYSSTASASTGARVPFVACSLAGAQVNINGFVKAGNGVLSVYCSAGTVNWKSQNVTVNAGEEVSVFTDNTGAVDISNLTVTNSGKVIVVRNSTAVLSVTGASITNTTSTSQAAVIGATMTINNQPSTVSYMPTAAQVQAGVVFGYVGSTLIGTAGLVDYASIANAVWDTVRSAHATPGTFGATTEWVSSGAMQIDFTQSIPTLPVAGSTGEAMFYLSRRVGHLAQYRAGSTTTTLVLDANASPTDNAYRGYFVNLTQGTGAGQNATCLAYDGQTKTMTIGRNGDPTLGWTVVPDLSTYFLVEPFPMSNIAMVGGTLEQGGAVKSTVAAFTDPALLQMRNNLNGVVLTVGGPVWDDGSKLRMTLTAGDDYSAMDSRAIQMDLDGTVLPDLSAATVQLRLSSGPTRLLINGTIVVATGSVRTVRFEPAASQTVLLPTTVNGLFAVLIHANGRSITPEDGRGALVVAPRVAP